MEPKNVVIELPVEAWNVVINALSQRPYGEVSAVIDEMRRQASPQLPPVDPNAPTAPVEEDKE